MSYRRYRKPKKVREPIPEMDDGERMPHPRTILITTPTGWDTGNVREYAEHKIRHREAAPSFARFTMRLEQINEHPNHTTDWRVTYVIHQR